jgi:hypothetical protein
VTITLNLSSGSYPDLVASPPTNVNLVLNGAGSAVTFVGHSSAFTVTTGSVTLRQMTFKTATNSPTVLVTGGSLTTRGDTVQESTGGNQPALLLSGGTVDLGTAAQPGNNTFNVNGSGLLLRNTTQGPVSALGDTFEANGVKLTDPYRIENLIDDGLDTTGPGLVTFVAQNAFVTNAGGDLQRAINLVPAGYTINVQAGYPAGSWTYSNLGHSHEPTAVYHSKSYTVGSKPLTIAFQNGPSISQRSDSLLGNALSLFVQGTAGNDTILFLPGAAGQVGVQSNGLPAVTFAPTGRLVAHGMGGHDVIEVSSRIQLPAWLYADNGSALLVGGGGNNVLVGGSGKSVLVGGPGRDILIASSGGAVIQGGTGGDVLIGGTTNYDNNESALLAVMAEWSSSESYLQRIANLQNAPVTMTGQTVNPNGNYQAGYFLNATTVHDNGVSDHLQGGSAQDWYFASLGDKINQVRSGEVVTRIS